MIVLFLNYTKILADQPNPPISIRFGGSQNTKCLDKIGRLN